VIAWEARRSRLVSRIRALDADVACLQEVEPYVFRYLEQALEPDGLAGIYALKARSRPDGSATFYRSDRLELVETRKLYFHDGDGDADSGHLALQIRFRVQGHTLAVTNTHIRWDEPDRRGAEHVGYRQVAELLRECTVDPADACVICGDFNTTPELDRIRLLAESGFTDAYASAPQPTANSDSRAKRIDYLFVRGACTSVTDPLPRIDDETPLPSETEPSDHLPISATLTFTP
jgi:endonuclease/exonuclease/phosphatase family metal-dependent hydrolase